MSEKKANKILDKDDDHEFWRSDSAKTVVSVHKRLVDKGLDKDEAAEIIQSVWSAAASEYGD